MELSHLMADVPHAIHHHGPKVLSQSDSEAVRFIIIARENQPKSQDICSRLDYLAGLGYFGVRFISHDSRKPGGHDSYYEGTKTVRVEGTPVEFVDPIVFD
ncbi:MAG TPA: hypothetical protein VJI52_04105 [Candidatus Nanoarchaeia archaeon]|nr:hypothetical protein [Candidatus Nanoarchaeia archaeon]